MSSVVTGVLNLTVGPLYNKLRDEVAKKLKEGDLMDGIWQQWFVNEFDEINGKLDDFARISLRNSISDFNEGIVLLKLSLDDLNDKEENCSQTDESTMMKDAESKRSASLSSVDLNKVVECFEKACEKASTAFHTTSLTVEERIFATKLRVMSKILQSHDSPNKAAQVCKDVFLKELHDLGEVQSRFSLLLNGGIWSWIGTEKRKELVVSITIINFILFCIISRFAKKPGELHLLKWPKIKLGYQTYQPMFVESEILKRIQESGVQAPNQFTYGDRAIRPLHSVVNSKHEIIAAGWRPDLIYVINRKNEMQPSCIPLKEIPGVCSTICSLATDEEDNIYIVTRISGTGLPLFKLSVFDPNGKNGRHHRLKFLSGGKTRGVNIAVSNDKKIIIHRSDEGCVHVCDNFGQLKYNFHLEGKFVDLHLSITHKNEIIAAPRHYSVYIYTVEGKLKRTFKVPDDQRVFGVAFDRVTENVLVHARPIGSKQRCQLSCYSETSELQILLLPHKYNGGHITSHPTGPVALVDHEGVTFIN